MSRQASHAASFRDPNGFIFTRDGLLYRQINQSYAADYAALMGSGLYEKLQKSAQLIPHQEVEVEPMLPEVAWKVIQPEPLAFISHPYEWSFSQLRDAAVTTLSIQRRALKAGLTLKDASAYNIQFRHGRATLIDTLSFEIYHEGEPWVAYKQFCQHFLAPLSLMALTDIRLGQLLRVYMDGVPLDLASRLLPFSSRFNLGLLTHIHLHARAQSHYSDEQVKAVEQARRKGMSKQAQIGLIESLMDTVKKLEWKPAGTEWGNYYQITNYSGAAFEHKKALVSEWTARLKPASVWDLGANNGEFTRIAAGQGIPCIAFDIDPAAVEQNYRQVRSAKEQNLLPLLMDLTNPSPALGWHHRERESLGQRAPAGLVYALALIHHLAISNNVPLARLADFFYDMGQWLVIEFVPKTDSQVEKLLRTRQDIFDQYTLEGFEAAFTPCFEIREKVGVKDSERTLYLMERRQLQITNDE